MAYFFPISTSSNFPLDVEVIWDSHITAADGTGGQRSSEGFGDPTQYVMMFFDENSINLNRLYEIFFKWSGNPSVELDSEWYSWIQIFYSWEQTDFVH